MQAEFYIVMRPDGTAMTHTEARLLPWSRYNTDGTPHVDARELFLTAPRGQRAWYKPATVTRATIGEYQVESGPVYGNLDQPVATISYGAAALPYRKARKLAYANQLGVDSGDVINTLGDVLDEVIAEIETMRVALGAPATPSWAAMINKIQEIKAQFPKPI